ncbi:MAG TPA: phosphate ABC transporter substrate-binding protein PstS, partial [Crinalium sp.]
MGFKRRLFLISAFALSLGFTACASPDNAPSTNASTSPDTSSSPAANASGDLNASLSGAGASFPAPLYQRWFSEFNKQNSGVQVSYQSVGSGAGVEQYLSKTVDFGASDAPLTPEERQSFKAKYGTDPVQVPMTGGAVVLAYNLPGVQDLKISRDAFCGIVQGQITNWNDPKIAQANSGTQLPDKAINWVHRSDGSGTTYIFTNHIKAACPNWTAGSGKSVEWPVGAGAKGNEGVTAQIQQSEGSIGYVEYAYANENGLTMATLANKAGNYVKPSPESAALAFE